MRLIDADALIEQMEADAEHLDNAISKMMYYAAISDVKHAPTIEPERKTGEWIEQGDGWDGVYYECSVCKEAFTLIDGTPSDNFYNFCPNCGADMRGEAE